MRRSGFTVLLAASAFSVTLLIAGCHSNSIDGIYEVATGQLTLQFKEGKAYLTTGGLSFPDGMPYEVKGDKVILHNVPNMGGMFASDMTLTREKDGSLRGDFGLLTKRKGS